jgi:hypothetical protein
MDVPNPESFVASNGLSFSPEGLALMEKFRAQAEMNPAPPLTNIELETIGGMLCSEKFGEDFAVIRQFNRRGTSVIWADRNTGYLNEDGITMSYTKHGQIGVYDGQTDVIKASCTTESGTCYYVFDRNTLEQIPERTIITASNF